MTPGSIFSSFADSSRHTFFWILLPGWRSQRMIEEYQNGVGDSRWPFPPFHKRRAPLDLALAEVFTIRLRPRKASVHQRSAAHLHRAHEGLHGGYLQATRLAEEIGLTQSRLEQGVS